MSRRIKVLMSSFACQPHTGSEPEVGWQWALQMARHHDVAVLTRELHRPGIEEELAKLKGTMPLPEFIYLDENPLLMKIYHRFKTYRINCFFWQKAAWHFIEKLKKERQIDLIHHVTYAGYRSGTAIWGHDIPTVWGPVGGIHSIPFHLLPWSSPESLGLEIFRLLNNLIQTGPIKGLRKRVVNSTVTLVSTYETQKMIRDLGLDAELMPTIGLHVSTIPAPQPRPDTSTEPLKVLWVGNLRTVKGIDLAVDAFGLAKTRAHFTIVGDGPYMAAARKRVVEMGVQDRVTSQGRVPTQEVLKFYYSHDVLLFPTLGDTGGFAAIEAMCCAIPVIALDCGGPKMAVRKGTGILVPLGSRNEILQGLATAIEHYDQNRNLIAEHGRAAREVILKEYDWQMKALHMLPIYERAVGNQG
jgi:glycosyltransferase involved in cell wall biosynthesis